jgi:hypothetical protein
MLMALFLSVGYFCLPPPTLHDFLGPKDSLLEKVMTIDTVGIFNQVGILDIPPPITVAYFRDVPSVVVYGTGYELAEFYRFFHGRLLWAGNEKGDLSQ